MKSMLSVTAGIAVAGALLLGSMHASAMPASGTALLPAIQKAKPVRSYKTPKYKRCRADFKEDRFGKCVPNSNA